MVLTAGPLFDPRVDVLPAAQVEVADAEVRAVGDVQRLSRAGRRCRVDVVEDARHSETAWR